MTAEVSALEGVSASSEGRGGIPAVRELVLGMRALYERVMEGPEPEDAGGGATAYGAGADAGTRI